MVRGTAGQWFVVTRDDGRMTRFDVFGPNSGFVEELYRRYLDAPTSVDAHWRAYFAAQEAAEGANLEGSESPEAADVSAVAWSFWVISVQIGGFHTRRVNTPLPERA